MFALQYLLSVTVLSLIYKFGKSEKSFNNWLFDYVKDRRVGSTYRVHGILYLLLSFEEKSDHESLEVCFNVFEEDINSHLKLSRFRKKIKKRLDEAKYLGSE